jgi:hypothetical protein
MEQSGKAHRPDASALVELIVGMLLLDRIAVELLRRDEHPLRRREVSHRMIFCT